MYFRRFSRAGGRAASPFSAVISSSKRKYCTENPSCTALTPRPMHRCDLPTPGGPCSRTVSASRIQAQVASVSIRDRSIAGWKAKSKFSSVCPVGRFDSRSDVFTRRSSRPDSSAASSRSRNDVRRHLLAHRLPQQGPELLGGVAAAQRQQALARRVDVEPRPARAHRATSASAA